MSTRGILIAPSAVDGDVHDRRDVAHETVVRCDAETLALGNFLPQPASRAALSRRAASGPYRPDIAPAELAVVPVIMPGSPADLTSGRSPPAGSLSVTPAAAASSATNDWTANAWGMSRPI